MFVEEALLTQKMYTFKKLWLTSALEQCCTFMEKIFFISNKKNILRMIYSTGVIIDIMAWILSFNYP